MSYTKKITKSILAEYKEKKLLYAEFVDAMQNVLSNLLQVNGFKHQITCRVKDEVKLEEKIRRKLNQGKKYETLGDVEDVAGVRVLFYVESDVEKFAEDLFGSFADGALRREDKNRENGYKSVHIIAKFEEQRLNLPEYFRFKDLKCEIQLATILHHAWSEVEHELIYKDEKQLKADDRKMFFGIQNRLYSIMANYLDKASGEIENIYKKVARSKKKNGS